MADTKQESKRQVAEAFVEKWPIFASAVDAVELLLKCRDERAAKILEQRADELQREWDAPPNAENGFIEMTADTPAGYATFGE